MNETKVKQILVTKTRDKCPSILNASVSYISNMYVIYYHPRPTVENLLAVSGNLIGVLLCQTESENLPS